MKRVAVLQSNYIPWKGYFDIIHDVDEFVFYDEVQFTKNDWRNRNKLIMNQELRWITVPVGANIHQKILDVRIENKQWQRKHFNILQMNYGRAKYFKKYRDFFYDAFLTQEWEYLYQLNRYLIEHIAHDFLHINVKFTDSREYFSEGTRNDKLLSLLCSARATQYVSGPAAKSYMDTRLYEEKNIAVVWKDYSRYPIYQQNSKVFHHDVSILDLLFNLGEESPYYIWGWRG